MARTAHNYNLTNSVPQDNSLRTQIAKLKTAAKETIYHWEIMTLGETY